MTEDMISKISDCAGRVFFPFLGKDNVFTNGIPVRRVMFTIPGINFDVYWYGFIIAIGLMLALLFADSQYKKFGINPDKAYWVVLGGAVAGIIGARAYYVLFSLDTYIVNGKIDWKEVISIRDGGLAIYGGVIAAFVVAAIICKKKKIRMTAMFDIAGMGFLIGQCVGRWGNFVNQEAFGSNTKLPWGMTSSKIISYITANADDIFNRTGITVDPLSPVHPTFLYESLWCLIGFILLLFYKKHRKFDGELFLMYIGWYGLGRGFIEGLRTDSLFISGTSLRISQLVGYICFAVAVILIIVIRLRIKKKGDYKFFYETDESIASLADHEKSFAKEREKKNKVPKDMGAAIENAFDDNTSETSEELSSDVNNETDSTKAFEAEASENSEDTVDKAADNNDGVNTDEHNN